MSMSSSTQFSVFFAGSSRGLTTNQKIYQLIVDSLESLGHTVLPSWIVTELQDKPNNAQHPTSRAVLEQQQALLRTADLMVVECQIPSFGIGFLMHLALQERVPILCLYPKGSENSDLSDMILGNSSSLVSLRPYVTSTLHQVISEYCDSLQSDDLHKFNFIASREILNFIADGAKASNKSKSEFLRDELTQLIRSNKQQPTDQA